MNVSKNNEEICLTYLLNLSMTFIISIHLHLYDFYTHYEH